jgi:protein ImuB
MGTKHRVACLYFFGNQGANKNGSQKTDFSGVEKNITALAEACYRYTPQIAVRTPVETENEYAIFLEIGACHRLYSEELLKIKLATLAKRFGWFSRVTLGDSAAEAFALARNPSYLYLQDLPLSAVVDYVTPFGVDPDLERKLAKVIHTLQLLGLKNVGEFATIAPRTLSSRFGKEAVELSARIRKQLDMPWPGFHPSLTIVEKSSVENSENLEALGFVLKGLVDRAIARLHGRCERASIIQIDFDLVKWGRSLGQSHIREFRLELPIAQGSTRGLFPIIQEHLSAALQRDPLTSPVDSIHLQILESVPSRGSQRDFFTRKEEESEVWDALVARLSLKIGAGKVYTAVPVNRYLPEKAYTRSIKKLSDQDYVSPPWPHRPTRLLKNPQPLSESAMSELGGQLHGPERISGEWWNSQYEGFFRDYYRLKTTEGQELWVFRNCKAPSPEFYLQGYFD